MLARSPCTTGWSRFFEHDAFYHIGIAYAQLHGAPTAIDETAPSKVARVNSCRPPSLIGLASALALAVSLAGCGSYTTRDFAAQADAVCVSAVRQIRALAPPAFTGSAAQRRRDLAAYLNRASGIAASETAQLRAIRRPAQDARRRAGLARYLAAMEGTVSAYRTLATAVRAGNQRAVVAAESALAADPVGSLAAAYGLRSCATPGATIR